MAVMRQVSGNFQHPGDSRGVVIGPAVDGPLPFPANLRLFDAEMIVVGDDRDRFLGDSAAPRENGDNVLHLDRNPSHVHLASDPPSLQLSAAGGKVTFDLVL